MPATVGEVIEDWVAFWQMIHSHIAWDLEWYDPSAGSWVSVRSDLTIRKNYVTPDSCKFSLIFSASQTGNYRLTFGVDVRVRAYLTKLDKYQYVLDYDDFQIIFDWSDIISLSELQITHGIKTIENADYFWFRIRRDNIPKDTHVELDPTVIGTSTSTTPVIQPYQKKCFYANGRWWVFYYNGSNFGWKTSTDGSSWTSFINYGAYVSQRFDIWYDQPNNKICLARCQGGTANIYYRQGTANSDGTISWDSAEVQITSDSGYGVKLCKDSNGFPWVSYLRDVTYDEKAVKATTTNGSSWGTPTTLWTNRGSGQEEIMIVPLSNGRMMALSAATNPTYPNRKVQSRLYDGSSWATAVDASASNVTNYNYYDAVADGDNVHLAFIKETSLDVVYVKYTYGSGWGNEETVESATVSQNHPTMTFKSADKVRVYYLLSQTAIKYRDRDAGSWQTAVAISSSESAMTCVTSAYQAFSGKMCVTWKSGASSPYDVKFEGYTLAMVKEVADSLGISDSVLGDKVLSVLDSVGLADLFLRDKTFAVTDLISISEIISVATGVIIKYVADAIGLAEQIRVGKVFVVSDALCLADVVLAPMRVLCVLDAIGLSDSECVSKVLVISDQMTLAEVVEKAVAGGVKTKIFLIMGDLAIQIAG